MKRLAAAFILILFSFCDLYSQEKAPVTSEDTEIQEKVSLHPEKERKKNYMTEIYLFGSIPVVILAWGIGAWGWGT
ncbi:MAG: hypothetical protein GY863_02350, partial [bacterium]|nr:hypothetical protein [bacterium]